MAIQQTVQQYFMFQTKIIIEQFYQENGLVLPAVTICNSNRVHCGNLYQEARKAELVSFLMDNLKQSQFYKDNTGKSHQKIYFLGTCLLSKSIRIHRMPLPEMLIWFQEDPSGVLKRTQILCKLFILSQCPITLSVWEYRNIGMRKWTDICLDFTKAPNDTKGTSFSLFIFLDVLIQVEGMLPFQ